MSIAEYIKEVEAQTGKPMSGEVVRFAEQLEQVAAQFESRGREDAANGLPEPAEDMFLNWSKKAFENDLQMINDVAVIMQIQYMKGYNAGERSA